MSKPTTYFIKILDSIRKSFDWLTGTIAGKILLALLVSSLIGRWFYYVDKYSVNVLFYDMWTFYEPLFNGESNIWELYTWQHGPHRQGVGFILTKYIDQLSGWNTRWISFTVLILLLLTSFVYLRVKKHLFEKLNFLDVIIVFIVLMPVQYGLFANTPNISHGAAPALLLALLCLSWFIINPILRYATVILVNFLLIYSGFGFLIGLVTPLIILMDLWHYRKDSRFKMIIISALILTILSFASFFVDYRFNETANPNFKFPHDKPLEYLEFMTGMMANALSSEASAGVIGIILCVLIGVYHLRRLASSSISNRNYLISKVIIMLMTFSFLFMASTAIGRVSIGLDGVRASRYTSYILPAVVAIYLHICGMNKATYKVLAPICLVFLLVKTTFIHYEVGMMKNFRNSKVSWKETYLETGSIEKASEASFHGIHQNAEKAWLQKRLDFLEENHLNLFLDKEEK